MDLRQLRYFTAVVEHGGMTRAAQALFVAQPALSQALRALETELGVELFDRVGRGLELSAAGRALLGPARQLLAGSASAVKAVRRIEQVVDGSLDVAVISELATEPLARWLAEFSDCFPAIAINIVMAADSAQAAAMVREATCEVALCSRVEAPPGTRFRSLGSQVLLLALPPGHPAVVDGCFPIDALERLEMVAGPPGSTVRDLLDRVGARLRVAVEIELLSAHPALVAAGAGAAVLPAHLAAEAAHQGAVLVPLRPALDHDIGLLHRSSALAGATRELLAIADRLGIEP